MLHAARGKQQWCGPVALASITGLSTDDIEDALRLVNPDRYKDQPIDTTWWYDLVDTLEWLGCDIGHPERPQSPRCFWLNATVAQFSRAHAGTWLIRIKGHFLALDLDEDKWVDSGLRTPGHMRRMKYKRSRVTNAIRVYST